MFAVVIGLLACLAFAVFWLGADPLAERSDPEREAQYQQRRSARAHRNARRRIERLRDYSPMDDD